MSTRSASQQLKVGHCSFLALPSSPPCTMLRSTTVIAARRSMQDWVTWRNYLLKDQWDEIGLRPSLAFEIILMHMHKLGLKNPSEQTSASLAAGIAAAQHGGRVQFLSAQDMKTTFLAVKATTACMCRGGYTRSRLQPLSKGGGMISEIMLAWAPCGFHMQARIKQLAGRSDLSQEYVDALPPSPRTFLHMSPQTARAVFSADHLPVVCPMNVHDIALARSKINIRGHAQFYSCSFCIVRLQPHPSRMYARCNNIAKCMCIRTRRPYPPSSNDESFRERYALDERTTP